MKPLKIVIVTQNIYPKLSPRAHRSSQLAFGLADAGHDVTVYALLGNSFDYKVYQKNRNIKFKNLGKSKLGLADSENNSNRTIFNRGMKRLFWKVFMYPDIEMVPMIRKALKKEKDIDILISIAVPYINHFAIAGMKKISAKCWISDCGDPFTKNPFHKMPHHFEYFERKWSKKTNYIVVPIEEAKVGYFQEFRDKIKVIPQGFNFDDIKLADYKKNTIPTFAYSGVTYKDVRDPSNFLDYLVGLDKPFKLIVYSKGGLFAQYNHSLGDKMEIRDYAQMDDRALVRLVVEGDSRAFEPLFMRHKDIIYAMLVKRSCKADDVDDMLQEAFMKAFVNINRYNPDYDFGAWICTIAKNTFVDFNRSRRNKALNPENNLPLEGRCTTNAQAVSPTPEESIINAQQRAQIERYIATLPEDYRELFVLRFIEEYTYEEIAEALQMKLGTVKTRIFRVRAMMCKMITDGDKIE